MESATLTRPGPGSGSPEPGTGRVARLRAAPASLWARFAFAALSVAAVVIFFVYPTWPNYDSIYSLVWGRELLAGESLSFEAYRAPTQHPLSIAFGAALSLLGDEAHRVMLAATLLSFLALVSGVYRLGRLAFTPLVGAIAALLLVTRWDFGFLAIRGYIDVPFLAFIVWAAVLEAQRPRRGWPVFGLLAAAGMLRPEAWILSGLYFLWFAWRATWPQRALAAVLTWLAAAVWVATDYAVTGDPLFSLNSTSELAGELGRQRGITDVPTIMPGFFIGLVKLPAAIAGFIGLGLALWFVPRRAVWPLLLLLPGVMTFVLVALAGLSVIDRYLLVPSLAVMVFAAVTLGGWTMLREGSRARRTWMGLAAAFALYLVIFSALRLDLPRTDRELSYRKASHAALQDVLRAPGVERGLACGPVSVPSHKLIPDVRWVLGLPADRVLARSDARTGARADRGVAIFVHGRTAVSRQAFSTRTDPPLIQVPRPGFERVAVTRFYSAYVRCP
jgi:hypothetical protein